MNNPYAQPPHPQNNAYPSLQAQPGKYPTLPTPQNYQQHQHPFPAHQYSQQNQYYPHNNGFLPPPGPGTLQNVSPKAENAESLLNEARIRKLDQGLNSCFIQFYKFWLWLTVIGCTIGGAKSFYALLVTNEQPMLPIYLALLGTYSFWNVIQSIFGLLAISQKNLAKAKIAFWMMSFYVVPAVLVGIWFIVCIITYVPDPSDDSYYLFYAAMYSLLGIDIAVFLTHVLICLNGAWRVKKILQERKLIDERFNRSDDSLQA